MTSTPIQYQTYTNDPDILELVAQYKAAVIAADAAVTAYMGKDIDDHETSAVMQAKQAELDTIQTRLCAIFVSSLEGKG